MRRLCCAFLTVSASLLFGASAHAAKVSICHLPPGNPEQRKLIQVGRAAADRHVERHGDFLAVPEQCDGLDNDCDGVVDNDVPGVGEACAVDVLECTFAGVQVCAGADGLQCDAEIPEILETEVDAALAPDGCSDDLDNDCDGLLDCDDPDCDGDAHCQPRRVFSTSDGYRGDLGGLAGANEICQSHADAASLGGSFRAWLADSTTGPADTFERSPVPYVRTDGATVADDWDDLTDGTIQNLIEVNEFGSATGVSFFKWTNVTAAGAPENIVGDPGEDSCQNWTSDEGNGSFAAPDFFGGSWTESDGGRFDCGSGVALYCFEQGGTLPLVCAEDGSAGPCEAARDSGCFLCAIGSPEGPCYEPCFGQTCGTDPAADAECAACINDMGCAAECCSEPPPAPVCAEDGDAEACNAVVDVAACSECAFGPDKRCFDECLFAFELGCEVSDNLNAQCAACVNEMGCAADCCGGP
jgi:hypothetical protein